MKTYGHLRNDHSQAMAKKVKFGKVRKTIKPCNHICVTALFIATTLARMRLRFIEIKNE